MHCTQFQQCRGRAAAHTLFDRFDGDESRHHKHHQHGEQHEEEHKHVERLLGEDVAERRDRIVQVRDDGHVAALLVVLAHRCVAPPPAEVNVYVGCG